MRNWKDRLHEVIYEADTPLGKIFDVVLLMLILLSIIFVMIESVKGLPEKTYDFLYYAEWVITIFFSFEYIARIISIKRPSKYIFSFYGIIDLLSTIPLYLSFFIVGSSALLTVRALRLLRIFRILKISRYLGASNNLAKAIRDSRAKILVFLFAVVVVCIIAGTLMYIIEGEESGFKSIPISVYWCIVTLTTVGYGDIAPVTPVGQLLAALIMIMGYGIIAVPTGIVSAEYAAGQKATIVNINSQVCSSCNASKHQDGAKYCHNCGHTLFND
ncbi:ion transporter [Aquimarina sp. BL5]|uniref:ion transporter n=1 Tax=Aquimarina sp. BL5 TaxID=1714860 RepID=UPI000E4F42FC|nr:ion transporter [Aquimarina sp. BL5]AXT50108.1 ion transporter [Aquimarina sp. BL5]RKN03623.1 ion transporter [Aquimarina sp. BL5]